MTVAKKAKIAFVVQRYGVEVIGGAEAYTRQLAEKVASTLAWDIDVFTSAAKDYETWSNFYPATTTVINGVTVRRFKTLMPRLRWLFGPFNILMNRLWRLTDDRLWTKPMMRALERLWFLLQGPYCPALLKELRRRRADYDACFFVTYLYYPTVFGWTIPGRKAVLIPTAHDEPPFYAQLVGRMLCGVPRLLALSLPERQLLARRVGVQENSLPMLGYGLAIEVNGSPSDALGEILAADRRPYVLYLGRLSHGKQVHQLIAWFSAYNSGRGAPYRLILAGQRETHLEIPRGANIVYCGQVSDEDKAHLIKGAAVLVNPSPYESLSMIVIEAMLLNVPIIVNTASDVLKHYADVNPTVWGYSNQASFDAALGDIEVQRPLPTFKQDLAATQAWAKKMFSWDSVFAALRASIPQ